MHGTKLDTIQRALSRMVGELESLDTKLARLARSIPDPCFEDGTDAPVNLAGHLYGRITVVQQDELRTVIDALKHLSRFRASDISRSLESGSVATREEAT